MGEERDMGGLQNKKWCPIILVGGFNPLEKYIVKLWIISPGRDEHKEYFKPPPSILSPPHQFIVTFIMTHLLWSCG